MSKMFVHYKGTVAAFKAAGLEEQYKNHIVFIKGGETDGKGEAVYTHGQYYGDVKAAIAALEGRMEAAEGNIQANADAIDALAYFSKIKVGNTTASAANKEGTITFSAADPQEVKINVDTHGISFGLSEEFKSKVNTAASQAAAAAVKTEVDASILALQGVDEGLGDRIADLEAAVGNGTGSDSLSARMSAVEGGLADEIDRAKKAEETNAAAIQAEKERMDAFLADADVTEKAVDTLKEIQEYITSDGAAAEEMVANISAAQAAADKAQGEVDALEGVVAGVKAIADAAATQVALNAEIERADAAEKANAAAIDAIVADYLVEADKTELQANIDLKVAQSVYDAKVKELEDFWAWEEL